jgi:hypothetical protein
LQPLDDKSVIKSFVAEFMIGRPEVRVEVDRRGCIAHIDVLRSAPCGSTWFVAKQLVGVEVENRRELYERISESHHSYPCTASMEKDRELGDTILHKAGYIIRAAMLSEIPIDLEKVRKEDRDKEILRVGIIAELDAVNLYEQLAAMAEREEVKKVLLDIFQALLLRQDREQVEELEKGKKEVEELVE